MGLLRTSVLLVLTFGNAVMSEWLRDFCWPWSRPNNLTIDWQQNKGNIMNAPRIWRQQQVMSHSRKSAGLMFGNWDWWHVSLTWALAWCLPEDHAVSTCVWCVVSSCHMNLSVEPIFLTRTQCFQFLYNLYKYNLQAAYAASQISTLQNLAITFYSNHSDGCDELEPRGRLVVILIQRVGVVTTTDSQSEFLVTIPYTHDGLR